MEKIEIKQSVNLPLTALRVRDDNPQEMSDYKFNELVNKIIEEGWTDPIKVREIEPGIYEIFAGAHRYKAAMVLGMTEAPCIIYTMAEAKTKFNMVKDNMVNGKINAAKFTKLVNELQDEYGKEIVMQMMAMEKDEFEKVFIEVKRTLPPDLQKQLEDSKKEIKSIEDLSNILNRLFSEYGDTLDYGFMVFTYGGQSHLYVQMDKETKKAIDEILDHCKSHQDNINIIFKDLMSKEKISEVLGKFNLEN